MTVTPRPPKSPKRLRPLGLASVGVSAASIVAVVGGVTAPEASATDVPVLHWNIKGGCTDSAPGNTWPGACGQYYKVDILALSIGAMSNRPWTITLNEMCVGQYVQLAGHLGPLGYSPSWDVTNPSTGSACGQHGNAMFQLGPVEPESQMEMQSFAFQRKISAANPVYEGDKRSLMCRQSNTWIGPVVGCVTHLTYRNSYDGATTYYQDFQANAWSNTWYGDSPRTVGADRNTACGAAGASCHGYNYVWSTDYKDVDHNLWRKTFRPGNSQSKLDWIYGSYEGFSAQNDANVNCNIVYNGAYLSDHCIVSGDFVH